jgi:hypothetical protein
MDLCKFSNTYDHDHSLELSTNCRSFLSCHYPVGQFMERDERVSVLDSAASQAPQFLSRFST